MVNHSLQDFSQGLRALAVKFSGGNEVTSPKGWPDKSSLRLGRARAFIGHFVPQPSADQRFLPDKSSMISCGWKASPWKDLRLPPASPPGIKDQVVVQAPLGWTRTWSLKMLRREKEGERRSHLPRCARPSLRYGNLFLSWVISGQIQTILWLKESFGCWQRYNVKKPGQG